MERERRHSDSSFVDRTLVWSCAKVGDSTASGLVRVIGKARKENEGGSVWKKKEKEEQALGKHQREAMKRYDDEKVSIGSFSYSPVTPFLTLLAWDPTTTALATPCASPREPRTRRRSDFALLSHDWKHLEVLGKVGARFTEKERPEE